MSYLRRELEAQLSRAARAFPAVILTGPRRAGKTSLLRHLFPAASYALLEDPELVDRFRNDPRGFLDELELPVILDEVQNVPEIFAHVRARIDAAPHRKGRWLLTGSQEAPLMAGVTESMAGRAAVLQLLPFSARESTKVDLLRGGFPEVLTRPRSASLWFSSYLQTYLERDVRQVTAVRDLALFRRFLALVASRHGQVLNRSELAAPLGVSVPTVSNWLDVLETTAQIFLVQPYYENLGKRLRKSPKLYVADPGLACHLLGIRSPRELARSPFLGALFEGLVAAEIVKAQVNAGRQRELYWYRDDKGLEVDFLFPGRGGGLTLVECKSSRSIKPAQALPLQRLARALRAASRRPLELLLVHETPGGGTKTGVVAPEVRALDWRQLVDELYARARPARTARPSSLISRSIRS